MPMSPKSPPHIVFIINGFGLGNSTRCFALIQELKQSNITISAITSGNSYLYLKNRPEISHIFEIRQLIYKTTPQGKIHIWKTLLSFPTLIRQARHNERDIKKILEQLNPSHVVLDSQYLFSISLLRRYHFFSINNAKDVIVEFIKNPFWPPRLYLHLLFFEFFDFLYNLIFIRTVLCPQIPFQKENNLPLLVRKEIIPSTPQKIRHILIMLSGSTKSDFSLDLHCLPTDLQIDVIGVDAPNTPSVKYHGKVLENSSFLNQADLLIINAGYSSLCEAISLKKPTLLIPLPGHAEQYANAKKFSRLGIGEIAWSTDEISFQLGKMLKNIDKYIAACKTLDSPQNGAKFFANQILKSLD